MEKNKKEKKDKKEKEDALIKPQLMKSYEKSKVTI
jgi:hypothetical protein